VKITVYALSGALSALAGILYAVQYRQGKPEAGAGAELDAIAAVVTGGTSLVGGKGSMVGVLIFGFLGNSLVLKNIHSSLQLVLRGFLWNSSNGNLYYAYAKEA
jgi:simple sugar transport system permease protein